MQIIIDGRGKKMVKGGRGAAARQARFLRRTGAGTQAARSMIAHLARAYVIECEREGWTAGQRKHNRLVSA